RVHARARARSRAPYAIGRGGRSAGTEHAGGAAATGRGAAARMIRWDEPGYVVGFTTRTGGVSEGPYASLNLGRSTGDDVERVAENRRRACEELGVEAAALTVNRQIHSTLVNRASAGVQGEQGDGLFSDEPGLPMLALSADCVPIALAARAGRHLA